MEFSVVDSATHVTALFDHAQRLYPVMCHFEGWDSPKDIDFERMTDTGWSEDNPGLTLWAELEGDICRAMDMATAALAATGTDLSGIDHDLYMNRGDLVTFMTMQTKRELAARKFEEVFGEAINKNK
jgi:hypothetical protein|tara:strand:+ start:394 stop:774 length:381 start_codon:yes stop_codon:yes gene_type:complete